MMGDILIEVVWPQDGLPDDIKLFSEGNRRWIDITSPMMVTRQQAWAEGQRHSQDNAALRARVTELEGEIARLREVWDELVAIKVNYGDECNHMLTREAIDLKHAINRIWEELERMCPDAVSALKEVPDA